MQVVLALETSTDACSVALAHGETVYHRHHLEPRAHNRILLPMIAELLAEADLSPAELEAVAFGRGPGSFTGLRIAAAVTQGIAWPRDLPVLGVSTLSVLAASAAASRDLSGVSGILTLVDARMGELYWNAFRLEKDGMRGLVEDALATPAALGDGLRAALAEDAGSGRWLVVGSGLAALTASGHRLPSRMEVIEAADVLPDARCLLALARPQFAAGYGLSAGEAIPHYLQDERRWRRQTDPPRR